MVNFSRCGAPWFWAAPPQLRLLNPPRRAAPLLPATRGRVELERTLQAAPAGEQLQEEEEEEEEGSPGLSYELPLTAVQAAGLIAGSL